MDSQFLETQLQSPKFAQLTLQFLRAFWGPTQRILHSDYVFRSRFLKRLPMSVFLLEHQECCHLAWTTGPVSLVSFSGFIVSSTMFFLMSTIIIDWVSRGNCTCHLYFLQEKTPALVWPRGFRYPAIVGRALLFKDGNLPAGLQDVQRFLKDVQWTNILIQTRCLAQDTHFIPFAHRAFR